MGSFKSATSGISGNNNNNSSGNGNFHVSVRIRPTSSPNYESQAQIENQKYVRSGPENSILLVQPHSTQGNKVFIYDDVFDTKSKTKDIFEKVVRPNLTDSLFKGFSHTVLVYGMTGSGKTFTMFGECGQDNVGISPHPAALNLGANDRGSNCTDQSEIDGPVQRKEAEDNESRIGLVNEIVKMILSSGANDKPMKVKMSYLEIYNEQIRDLLSVEQGTPDNLMILEDPEKGVYCPLLIEREISSVEHISHLIKFGNKRRVMACTKLNEYSSRSHAIIQISLEIEIENDQKITTLLTPKLYMVDLAGSERSSATEAKGIRLKEGANINKSLLSLGNCITILSQNEKKKARHVPYRDSKLTRLLKESLGGNAKTLLIACVTPAFRFVEETINTLKYAQRAKNIEKDVYENIKKIYNKVPIQVEVVTQEIESLKVLLRQDQQDLQNLGSDAKNFSGLLLDQSALSKHLALTGQPPSEEQVMKSQQFYSHREKFREQFRRMSEHFEDILYRNRELELNLQDYTLSREQSQRQIHEIMDRINPTSLTQKEMKYRLDKVNMLRGIVKQNEEIIERFQKELVNNEYIKAEIKRQLESLYDVKFIKECSELSNFELYSIFEAEKDILKGQINDLLLQQQSARESERAKELQICQLKEEISYIKKKMHQTESILLSHEQQQQQYRIRSSKSRGKTVFNPRASSNLPPASMQSAAKTPRNNNQSISSSQQNLSNVTSRYMQFSSFVPSGNISVGSVRGRSVNNLRQSMYAGTQLGTAGSGAAGSISNNNNENFTPSITTKSFAELITSGGDPVSLTNPYDDYAPSQEFEEYKRKEQIIETQLKCFQKTSSTKNISNNSKASSSLLDYSLTAGVSPNRTSAANSKTNFKSSFFDESSNPSQHQTAPELTYKQQQSRNGFNGELNSYNCPTDEFNNNPLQQESMLFTQQFSSTIPQQRQLGGTKNQSFSGGISSSTQSLNKLTTSRHSKHPSLEDARISFGAAPKQLQQVPVTQVGLASNENSTSAAIGYSGGFYTIAESIHEQSMMNMTGQLDTQIDGNRITESINNSSNIPNWRYQTSDPTVLRQPSPNMRYALTSTTPSNQQQQQQQTNRVNSITSLVGQPTTSNLATFDSLRRSENSDRSDVTPVGTQQNILRQSQGNKLVNPSFNSYIQNKGVYGEQQQQYIVTPSASTNSILSQRNFQVPTTAIHLDITRK